MEESAKSRAELYARLEQVLGVASQYRLHYLSTPPTKSDALFAASPNKRPQRTYCESHFLTLSISHDGGSIFVFAIEVLVYTTASLTTLFVSKADSTGYLHLRSTGLRQSPIRPVTSTFISWLAETRQRPGIPLVVSLFARAQNQYLFPGSVDHGGKHVLDDRRLVKWWCKTLDPVLKKPSNHDGYTTRAHVIVPGFDQHETTSFFPPTWRSDPPDARKWRHGHPLLDIAPDPSAPPRCLVPHFPDDPKARYLDELDDEIPDSQPSQTFFSPSKKGNGMWKSIRTLDQFWDTMAFRQECSSGRLVGFIWLVFTPTKPSVQSLEEDASGITPVSSFNTEELNAQSGSSQDSIGAVSKESGAKDRRSRKPKKKTKLTGPIIPRQPRIKSVTRSDKSISKNWPEKGRGQIVLDHASYTRIHDLLLRLDFATADAATSSTRKWLNEIAVVATTTLDWGRVVTGVLEETQSVAEAPKASANQVNDLSGMIVRKKRKADASDQTEPPISAAAEAPSINNLSGSMIRKKPKVNKP